MARIGKQRIYLDKKVEFSIAADNVVTLKGDKGTDSIRVHPDLKVELNDNEIQILRSSDSSKHKALHGLYRSLLNNLAEGLSKGFKKQLEVIGVGYRAAFSNDVLELNLGFSHPNYFVPTQGIAIEVDTNTRQNTIIIIEGTNKELVGQVAAKIR